MKRLVPLLQKWIQDVDSDPSKVQLLTNNAIEAKRKRKRDAITDLETIQILQKQFLKNPNPTTDQITVMARSFDLEKDALRAWFQNRKLRTL
jgi:class 2 POU domain transcription factor